MKTIALADVKDNLSHYLKVAGSEDVVITKHGRPAGVLIGFKTEDEWFDYRIENDPRFLKKIEAARSQIRARKVTSWQDVKREDDHRTKRK